MARVATVGPIDDVVNGLPLGAITAAPALRQRAASRMSAVTTMFPTRVFGDPVVGRGEARVDDEYHQRPSGHPHRAVVYHRDARAVPPGDPVHLVLHRAGVGVDEDARAHRTRLAWGWRVAFAR